MNFDLLSEDWFDKKKAGNENAAVRLSRFNRWLAERPEKKILCIGAVLGAWC